MGIYKIMEIMNLYNDYNFSSYVEDIGESIKSGKIQQQEGTDCLKLVEFLKEDEQDKAVLYFNSLKQGTQKVFENLLTDKL